MPEGAKLETQPEAFIPSKEMLLKLFTPEQYAEFGLEKLSEEEQAKKIWAATDNLPGFSDQLKKIMDDPAEPKEFRDWLKKWMEKFAKELEGDLREGEKIMRGGIPIDAGGEKTPAEPPAQPPEEAGTTPPAEGQTPPEPVKPAGPEKPTYDVVADQANIKHLKNEDLFKTILERGTALFEGLKGLGASFSTMFAAPKLTPAQVKEVKVDLEKDKETKYTSDNRSVEYVCSVLNLPLQPSAEKLLAVLKSTAEFVYDADKNNFKDVKIGDVLFFQKAEKPGVPYSAGVVSRLEPLSMRIVTDAGVAREVEIKQSPQFLNEWLGFVRIPQAKEVQLPPQ